MRREGKEPEEARLCKCEGVWVSVLILEAACAGHTKARGQHRPDGTLSTWTHR